MAMSSMKSGLISRKLLVGNSYFQPTSFENIATTTLSSSAGWVGFSSIPQTYKHLQVRIVGRSLQSGAAQGLVSTLCNGDQTSSYASHLLYGNGTTVQTNAQTSNRADIGYVPTNGYVGDLFGILIIDYIDYASTSKYKTIRAYSGIDGNGSGRVALGSGLWKKTNAITSIDFSNVNNSYDWAEQSTFALYGIKG